MQLTHFGAALRKARIDARVSLVKMAEEIGSSASFISRIETGISKVPEDWVSRIQSFMDSKGVTIPDLRQLADIHNRSVDLNQLDYEHAWLVSTLANTQLSSTQILEVQTFLDRIRGVKP